MPLDQKMFLDILRISMEESGLTLVSKKTMIEELIKIQKIARQEERRACAQIVRDEYIRLLTSFPDYMRSDYVEGMIREANNIFRLLEEGS